MRAEGFYVGYGGLLLDGSTVSHNRGLGDGGGVCFSEGGLWMRSGLVEHNKAGGHGGGLYYASGLIEDSTIRYNEAITNTCGGLYSWSLILNSTISNNKAAEGGGIGPMVLACTTASSRTMPLWTATAAGYTLIPGMAAR